MVNILIGVLVVGWLVARQLQVRPVRETSALRLALILGVIGIIDTGQAMKGHHLDSTTVALLALGLVLGAGLGAVRALTVRIWAGPDATMLRQGTALTAVLWIASLAVHFGLDGLVDHFSGVSDLGSATILIYLAVTLSVQRELIRLRAAKLVPSAR